jgi:hypothetical protein
VFLRFITYRRDDQTRYGQGVFQAAYALRDSGRLLPHDDVWFEDTVAWFERNLTVPGEEVMDPIHDRPDGHRAIFWFHASAHEHVSRMRGLTALLEEHGIRTRTLRTRWPGTIVYQDRQQVVAIPRRDDVSEAPAARGRLRML